jgi:formylglycine-generating enzyme required for sulfatase activity
LWQNIPPIETVRIEGGAFFGTPYSNLFDTPIVLQDFYIGKFQVTQQEWIQTMGENPSAFLGDIQNPVESITWYDAVLFLNRRSEQAGLEPFYNIDKENPDPNNTSVTDEIRWYITINENANGYRLPTNLEWEYAAGGGQLTRGYVFSGSNDLPEVSWFFRTSGDEFLDGIWHWPTLEANNGRPRPVGQKMPNELGLYDMSGNVREWIFNWYHPEQLTPFEGEWRTVRGGSWVAGEDANRIYFYDGMPPYFATYELGLRVARNG